MEDVGTTGTVVSESGGWLFQNGRFVETYDQLGACLGSGGMGSVWASRIGDSASANASCPGRPAGSWVAVKAIPMELADGERTAGHLHSGLRECLSTFRDLSPVHVVRYDSYWMEEEAYLPSEIRSFWERGRNGVPLGSPKRPPPCPEDEEEEEIGLPADDSPKDEADTTEVFSPRFQDAGRDISPRFRETAGRDAPMESFPCLERGSSAVSGACATPTAAYASYGFESCGFVWESNTAVSSTAVASSAAASPSGVGGESLSLSRRGGHYEDRLHPPSPERRAPAAGAAREAVAAKRIARVVLMIQMELMSLLPGISDKGAQERLTLREWLQRRGPPWRTFSHAADVFGMLMLSVRHIHRKRLVHADLKPDNIFLVADRSQPNHLGIERAKVIAVRIGDFGLAGENLLFRQYSYGVLRKSGPAGGTPGYLAPELFSQDCPCSDKADLFACAVILLELLLPPFGTQMERSEFLEGFRIRNAVPEFLEVRLPKTRALLRDMGAEDPACRLSAEEVCKKFEKEVRKELCRHNIQRCCSPSILRVDVARRTADAGDQDGDADNRRQKGKKQRKPRRR